MVSPTRLYQSLRGVRTYLAPYRRECAAGVVGMLFNVLLLLPVPLLTKYLIDKVIPERDVSGVVLICVLSCIILIVSSSCVFLQRYFLGKFQLHVFRDVQLALVSKLQRINPDYRHAQQTGYLLARVTEDTGRLRSLFTDVLVNIAKDILILVVGVFLLFYLDWRLATVAIITLPFFVGVWHFSSVRVRCASARLFEQGAQYTKKLEETIGLLDTIIALHASSFDKEKLRCRQENVVEAGVSKNVVEGIAQVAVSVIGGLSPILIIGFGSFFIFQGTFSLGGLVAFNSIIGYVFGPSSRLVTSLLGMQQGVAAWERVQEIFQLPDHIKVNGSASGQMANHSGAISVELQNICIRYGAFDAVVDVSLHAPKGSFIALVGESGSGKSTLIRAILGTQAVASGVVLFDGAPMSAAEQLSAFRIAVLAQEPNLFATTIRENILVGGDDYAAMEQAARDAQIADFINSLPHGYDTMVNERGINLSVGQKQRIALARCLVANPNLLLLDEPTANLDVESEHQLWAALRPIMHSRTTIVAAHRLHTVVDADCIYVFSKGRIAEQGTHPELLKLQGLYWQLWNRCN